MILLLADTPSSDPHMQWVMIALGVVTLFYVVIIRPAMKKKRDPLERSPIAGSLNRERSVERQMQNLLVELSEMSRQISGQLDTRSQKLQMLIQDADERIAALQQQMKQGNPPKSQPSLEQAWTISAPAAPSSPRAALPAEPVDEQHLRVYALADQGRTASEIARELNRPRGEVELILDLRPKASAHSD